jgi:hypothetical protein
MLGVVVVKGNGAGKKVCVLLWISLFDLVKADKQFSSAVLVLVVVSEKSTCSELLMVTVLLLMVDMSWVFLCFPFFFSFECLQCYGEK